MSDNCFNFNVIEASLNSSFDLKQIKKITDKYNIEYNPKEVDKTIILETEDGDIVGTASTDGNIIKAVVVDHKYQGSNAFSVLISSLSEELSQEYKHIFIYTHPKNKQIFTGLGFKCIAEAPPYYSLYEFGFSTIDKYKKYLETKLVTTAKNSACIVMNCNPFTLGHQYLIEKAAKESDAVYVFIVETDKSLFPFKTRWDLVEKGVAHLDNVVLVKTDDYLVSKVSFPSYFLKDKGASEITDNQARLDLMVFLNHIVPVLNIKKRYVGTENYCPVTSAYNKQMHLLLPEHNVEVVEVERKSLKEDDYISASQIREAVKNDDWDTIKDRVPKTTYDFLVSEAAKPIVEKIKNSDSRH